ncbi:MAG TPA: hypothetical protein PKA58_28065 [Polyangium sp.]|nr:hypothetical protein [Polyangium sp.]
MIVPVQIRHWFVSLLSVGLGTAIFTANASSFAQPKSETKAACVTAYKEGQVHRKNGEQLSARDDFKVCAQNVCPVVLRKDCGPWLQKVEESIPSIVVNPSSATGKPLSDSRILVDGKAVEPKSPDGTIEMDPGAHVVRVEATGHNAVDRSIKLRTGEKKTILEIKLAPTKAVPKTGSRPIPGSFFAFSAVSLVGFGAFAGFGLHGNALRQDLESCKPACSPDRVDPVKRDYILADVGLGVGVIFLGLATWSFLTRPEVPRQTVSWRLNIAPGQSMLTLGGAF